MTHNPDLSIEHRGAVAVIRLTRAAKRNALNDGPVRIPRLIGVARMTDMMLTGRVYNAQDGEKIGFAQYLVPAGNALAKALEIAERVAQNAPLTNYALMHALPRIAEQPADQGYL